MTYHVIAYIIALVSIDFYFMLYKYYKTLKLLRINSQEKKDMIKEEDYTKLKDILSKWPIIIYAISAIIGGFYINFINPSQEMIDFSSTIKTTIEISILPLLIFLSFSIAWSYIYGIIQFIIGFKNGLISEKNKNNIKKD